MRSVSAGDLIWQPTAGDVASANLTRYITWLQEQRGLTFAGYSDLWQWSVTDIGHFWESLWDYFGIIAAQSADVPLAKIEMPGARWFEGAKLNFAENVIAKMAADQPVLMYKSEEGELQDTWRVDLVDQVGRLAEALRGMGVQRGDRVVAYLPNIPEAIVAVLAVASLGAIWSSCPPDFGSRSVLDRFTQIEPVVLLAVGGYSYGGKQFDRRDVVSELQQSLPTVEHTILLPYVEATLSGLDERTYVWDALLASHEPQATLAFEQVPFDHPLWILYSSGTTGLPKPIVHGHGGVLLELLKNTTFHNDLRPSDRFFWYSSTGWMMWNYMVGSLLTGCTAVIYNGSPGYPDMNVLWRLAAETRLTYFGTSAAYINACIKAEIDPGKMFDLSAIRAVGSTGSPLTTQGFAWIYEHINERLALESLSGGTDLCTAFVGGVRLLPIYAGEIQGAALGARVAAFDEDGEAIVGAVGELVITEPMPSMPLYFWGDTEMARYRASYFEMFPGVWRHGDWIEFNERGGCVIYGRSDSTINRRGVRMGTSEIYQAVESLAEIEDSLIIDLEMLGRPSYMPLFVSLRPGVTLDDVLIERIKRKVRVAVSPRHVPDEVFAVVQIPYTLSGKKMEVPIRRILLGHELDRAVNVGAMRNPEALAYFIDFRAEQLDGG